MFLNADFSNMRLDLRYTCHITRAQGSREIVPGDSGGPVSRFSGSALEAVGTVSGFNARSDSHRR